MADDHDLLAPGPAASGWPPAGTTPPSWAPPAVTGGAPAPGAATPAAGPGGWPAPWGPPQGPPAPPPGRRGPSPATIIIGALVGAVGLVGVLILAVLLLGSSSEERFEPVGQRIDTSDRSGPSDQSGPSDRSDTSSSSDRSDTSDRSGPSDRSSSSGSGSADSSTEGTGDERSEAGFLLSEEDLTDRFEADPVLEASDSAGPDSTRSFCDPETVPSAGAITERWSGDATWEIDLSVVVYESKAAARSSIEEKQAPGFRHCVATMYSSQGFGPVQGEVVAQDQTVRGPDVTVSAAVDGSSDMGATRMVVAYRLVGRATVSVRMFAATGEYGESRGAPAFDLDVADELTALIADRIG